MQLAETWNSLDNASSILSKRPLFTLLRITQGLEENSCFMHGLLDHHVSLRLIFAPSSPTPPSSFIFPLAPDTTLAGELHSPDGSIHFRLQRPQTKSSDFLICTNDIIFLPVS